MDNEDIKCEVPLSNYEVIKVLKAKKINNDLITYLESVQLPYIYPLESLREIKGLEADLTKLAVLSNTNNIDSFSEHDRKRINKYLQL